MLVTTAWLFPVYEADETSCQELFPTLNNILFCQKYIWMVILFMWLRTFCPDRAIDIISEK